MKTIGILLAIMIVLTGCGVDKSKITIEKERTESPNTIRLGDDYEIHWNIISSFDASWMRPEI